MKKPFFYHLCLWVLFLSFGTLSAQNVRTKPSSDELFTLGKYYYDQDKNDKAEELLLQIHPGDTNYIETLRMLGWLAQNNNRLDSAMDYYTKALSLPNSIENLIVYNIGTLLFQMKKVDEAHTFIDNYIGKYPYNPNFYYLKSDFYYKKYEYAKAEEQLIEAIRLSPFNANLHFRLSIVNLCRNRVVPAMLALDMTIALRSGNKKVINDLSIFEDICTNSYLDMLEQGDMLVFDEETDPRFLAIARVIASGEANKSSYKPKFKYKHIFVNNNELLFKELSKLSPGIGFYDSFYIPFFLELNKKKYTRAFFSYALETKKEPGFEEWSTKNKKELNEYVDWANKLLKQQRAYRFFPEAYGKGKNVMEFDEDGHAESIGDFNDGSLTNHVGQWKVFFPNGKLKAEANYGKDNMLDGGLLIYTENGDTLSVSKMVNGKHYGESIVFHPNGKLYKELNFVNDLFEGSYTEYSSSGFLLTQGQYTNDKKTGLWIKYYPERSIETKMYYINDELHGRYLDYFSNGKLFLECNYNEGLINGQHITYYADGSISRKGEAKDSRKIGVWKQYYKSGKLSSEEYFDETSFSLTRRVEYYRNGNISSDFLYNAKENRHGLCKNFSPEGVLFYELDFDNGTALAMKVYHADGSIRDVFKAKDGEMDVVGKYFNGNKSFEGRYAQQGKEGIWKYYNILGVLTSEETFKNGEGNGKLLDFNADGIIIQHRNYVDGNENGNRISFNNEGILIADNFFRDDVEIGVASHFYHNGMLENTYYNLNGNINGPDVFYDADNNIYRVDSHKFGSREKMEYYDTNGTLFTSGNFPYGSGTVRLTDPKGNPMRLETRLAGKRHAVYKTLNPDGTARYESVFHLGKEEGKSIKRSPNGNLQQELEYFFDMLHGEYRSYAYDGSIAEIRKYKLGELTDTVFAYWTGGKLFSKMPAEYGQISGLSPFYDREGNLMFVLRYIDDLLVSYTYNGPDGKLIPEISITADSTVFKTWYANGKLSAELASKGGMFHGVCKYYGMNAMPLMECNYLLSNFHGPSKGFYANGKLHYSSQYVHGQKHGLFRYFHPNGQVAYEEEYAFDELHGKVVIYSADGKVVRRMHYRAGFCTDMEDMKK